MAGGVRQAAPPVAVAVGAAARVGRKRGQASVPPHRQIVPPENNPVQNHTTPQVSYVIM